VFEAGMVGILRALLIGFVVLTAVYVVLWAYGRSMRKEKLEKRWDARAGAADTPAKRAAFIEAGMRAYEKSMRRKLIWLVYVIPLLAVTAIIFIVNNH
jgi:hypothetical protein